MTTVFSAYVTTAGLAYVAVIPCDFQVTTPARTVIRADRLLPAR